jgi:hypothetical protein
LVLANVHTFVDSIDSDSDLAFRLDTAARRGILNTHTAGDCNNHSYCLVNHWTQTRITRNCQKRRKAEKIPLFPAA